ncbi:L-ascorbate metabolism protein UlaG (beta-lactamase superfamily) [Bradyrhizobium elkanii]
MAAPNLTLTLVGGPTVLIEYDGFRLLTDPTFDPHGEYQGAYSPVRHRKTDGPALSVERIGKLDAVLLSHDHHFDNLDNAGRALLPHVGITYTTDSGAQRLGGNALGLAPFETRVLESDRKKLFVTATPARHGPVGVDAGDVVGFALGAEQPGDLLYVTGDTLWFEGTAEVARRFSPKLVVLFTGAAEPRGRFPYDDGQRGCAGGCARLSRRSPCRGPQRRLGPSARKPGPAFGRLRQVQSGGPSDPA